MYIYIIHISVFTSEMFTSLIETASTSIKYILAFLSEIFYVQMSTIYIESFHQVEPLQHLYPKSKEQSHDQGDILIYTTFLKLQST